MVRFALMVACAVLAVLPAVQSVQAQNVPVPTPNPLSKQQPQAKDVEQVQKETEGRKQEAERIYYPRFGVNPSSSDEIASARTLDE